MSEVQVCRLFIVCSSYVDFTFAFLLDIITVSSKFAQNSDRMEILCAAYRTQRFNYGFDGTQTPGSASLIVCYSHQTNQLINIVMKLCYS